MNNNPVRYVDPSGHCIGLIQCIVEVTTAVWVLGSRAVENGKLTNQDFIDAADVAAPAVASGSKESVSGYISEFVTGVVSNSLITTSDGKTQLFNETGIGGSLPGVGVSVTHGWVYGLETSTPQGDDPRKYTGGATQGNLSIPLPICDFACGPYIEGYKADKGSKVWGIDIGVEFGFGPTIIGGAHTNAQPTDKVFGIIPAEKLNTQLTGPQLLGCRLLSMCGAQ